MNITHPCKQLVLDIVDELDPDAEHLGAVNLVVFDDGRLIGYNTDWMGYRDGLIAGLPEASFDRVVQVGCGGAGAATAYALLSCGTSRLDLFDVDDRPRARTSPSACAGTSRRRPSRPCAPASFPRPSAAPPGSCTRRRWECSTTRGSRSISTCSGAGAWVSDVVYRPLETELIRQAAERGHPVLDGGRMAVGQAYASLQIITGTLPDRDRMERHFRALIGAEERSGAGGGS